MCLAALKGSKGLWSRSPLCRSPMDSPLAESTYPYVAYVGCHSSPQDTRSPPGPRKGWRGAFSLQAVAVQEHGHLPWAQEESAAPRCSGLSGRVPGRSTREGEVSQRPARMLMPMGRGCPSCCKDQVSRGKMQRKSLLHRQH